MTSHEHTITIRTFPGRVRVVSAGHLLANTVHALELSETGYWPVYYVPRSDVRMDLITPSATRTTCPHKGIASYWSIPAGGERLADVAWSYEDPLPEVREIAGLLAFAPDKIDAIESTTAGPA